MAEIRDLNSQLQITNLNADELEAMRSWLTSYELPSLKNCKKLNREFSDGFVLAELLKVEFPTLVENHNYSRCSSVQSKIDNWNMLQKRVLRKLNIHLKCDEIEKLAKADNGLIEAVLFRIMNQIQSVESDNQLERTFGKSSDSTRCRRFDQADGDHDHSYESKVLDDDFKVAEEILKRDKEIEKLRGVVRKLHVANWMKKQQIEKLHARLAKNSSQKSMFSLESMRNSFNKFF